MSSVFLPQLERVLFGQDVENDTLRIALLNVSVAKAVLHTRLVLERVNLSTVQHGDFLEGLLHVLEDEVLREQVVNKAFARLRHVTPLTLLHGERLRISLYLGDTSTNNVVEVGGTTTTLIGRNGN